MEMIHACPLALGLQAALVFHAVSNVLRSNPK